MIIWEKTQNNFASKCVEVTRSCMLWSNDENKIAVCHSSVARILVPLELEGAKLPL